MDLNHKWNISFKVPIIGFVVSLLLLLATYFIVAERFLSGTALMITVVSLCTIQAFVQLVCFMHLGIEAKPRWNLITFLFMVLIIFVVIGGSMWIMYNLNYNMMPGMGH